MVEEPLIRMSLVILFEFLGKECDALILTQCTHYVKAESNEWRSGWFKRWNWRGWQRRDWVQRVSGDHELDQAAADAGRGQQGGEAEAGLQQDRGARRQDSEGGPRQTSNRKHIHNICTLYNPTYVCWVEGTPKAVQYFFAFISFRVITCMSNLFYIMYLHYPLLTQCKYYKLKRQK